MLHSLDRYIATAETSRTPVLYLPRYFLYSSRQNKLAQHCFLMISSFWAYSQAVFMWSGHLTLVDDLELATIRSTSRQPLFREIPFPRRYRCVVSTSAASPTKLDVHRKRQQAQHPKLTLTDMYNVLEKLRSGEALTAKERQVHEQGLVSVLKQLHDELDLAVFDAYGWPSTLTDEEIPSAWSASTPSVPPRRPRASTAGSAPTTRPPPGYGSRLTSCPPPNPRSSTKPATRTPATSRPPPVSPGRRAWPSRRRRSVPCWPRWTSRPRRSKSPPGSTMRRWSELPSCWRRWPVWGRLRRQGRGGPSLQGEL